MLINDSVNNFTLNSYRIWIWTSLKLPLSQNSLDHPSRAKCRVLFHFFPKTLRGLHLVMLNSFIYKKYFMLLYHAQCCHKIWYHRISSQFWKKRLDFRVFKYIWTLFLFNVHVTLTCKHEKWFENAPLYIHLLEDFTYFKIFVNLLLQWLC